MALNNVWAMRHRLASLEVVVATHACGFACNAYKIEQSIGVRIGELPQIARRERRRLSLSRTEGLSGADPDSSTAQKTQSAGVPRFSLGQRFSLRKNHKRKTLEGSAILQSGLDPP